MLLALALSALALSPSPQAPAPAVKAANSEVVTPPAPTSLGRRLEAARLAAAPQHSAQATLREQQRLAALFPPRPADALGSAARRQALGLSPQQLREDPRLGSSARRALLSRPPPKQTRARR